MLSIEKSSTTGPSPDKVRVVLCWHMHQPSYVNPASGDYELPWTYLHGIKDYTDMAAHLEANPQARAVVNFSPILIEQIEDYAEQIKGFLASGERLRDPLLNALAQPVISADPEHRRSILEQCRRINRPRLVDPYPQYRQLMEFADLLDQQPTMLRYLDESFHEDLVTWYHLAWLGETVRGSEPLAKRLIEKGHGYSVHERREILALIGEQLSGLLPRYRKLAEQGRVELSMTPYGHPILPLLQDLQSALEAWPDAPMPEQVTAYPGGEERARWHLEHGREVFERAFDQAPHGCWPSEGALSEPTVRLLSECGFKWAASGSGVLENSLNGNGVEEQQRNGHWHRAYIFQGEASGAGENRAEPTRCFFRDDGLSDAIGFVYSDWHGDDAVANLVVKLEEIVAASEDPGNTVISIIMDGENAWEHYPANGYYFLSGLYEKLSEHPRLHLTTFAEAIEQVEPIALDKLVAGSWVYGTLSTWIGEVDKNRAWELLVAAKQAYDSHIDKLEGPARDRAERQLAICESSDWFWWFGDYNPPDVVRDFDHLFRIQLAALYQSLGLEPPQELDHRFTHIGTGSPQMGGVMRQGRLES
ncbi:glycoside hydrolase family 57 protein [Halorhodospira halochloris]|uniref:glycoside hydrolase family 57 protein n=1 Tax=Halorhodospira halochloris TaxID=1052 RepID=UPI001EE7C935|nr:glycoside hydrolase family 57 protein [Halorhodospira halochloris]MCG5549113.1 glycoside hydrolase [Halorhodospira halochloris]